MRPILWDAHVDVPVLGAVTFPSYLVMLAASFGIGMWMTFRAAPAQGMDRERVLDLGLWLVLWALVGSRVLHVLAEGHLMEYVNLCLDPTKVAATEAKVATCTTSAQCGFDYVCNAATSTCHPPRDCLATLKIWKGGMAFYGGFIFASVFGLAYARKHRLGMGKMADLAAPWIAMGLALTRMGCFLNGCCYGKLCDLGWCVRFPSGSPAHRVQLDAHLVTRGTQALAVHPTQIYLAALDLATFFVLTWAVSPRKRFHGAVFLWLLVIKGVTRAVVEIWRDDERGVFFGGWLSTSQLISIPMILVGAALLIRLAPSPREAG